MKEEVKNCIEPYDEGDWLSYKAGTTDVAELILGYIDQVEQPELPEIPDYVADYIESRKRNNYPIYQSIRIACERTRFIGTKLNKWLLSNKNQETFAKAWVNGYTAEERKYQVILETRDMNKEKDFLGMFPEGKWYVHLDSCFEIAGTGLKHTIESFTEQEIKDYDERFWAFAKPVEELEE